MKEGGRRNEGVRRGVRKEEGGKRSEEGGVRKWGDEAG
jgi:hypothetical protein